MRTVREECKRRHGGEPCVKLFAADHVTVVETAECVDWCPVLRREYEAARHIEIIAKREERTSEHEDNGAET